VAKLRELEADKAKSADGSDSLIIFDCKMGQGHFGSSGRYGYLKEIAGDYAFIISHLEKAKSKVVSASRL
jgi:oligopeptidase B